MSVERKYLDGTGDVFGPTLPTPEQQELLREIKKLETEMIKRRKHYNYTDKENADHLEKKLFEIQESYYLKNQHILSDLLRAAETHKTEYLRDREKRVAQDALELERWRLRYQALDKKSLEEEAGNYLNNDGPEWTEDRLDLLNAALVKAGVKKIGQGEPVEERGFAGWISERHGREPWRKTAPEIYKAIEFYNQPFGEMHILEENGEIQTMEIAGAYMERTDG